MHSSHRLWNCDRHNVPCAFSSTIVSCIATIIAFLISSWVPPMGPCILCGWLTNSWIENRLGIQHIHVSDVDLMNLCLNLAIVALEDKFYKLQKLSDQPLASMLQLLRTSLGQLEHCLPLFELGCFGGHDQYITCELSNCGG